MVYKDEKYASIALDFLGLLAVRRNLARRQLLAQPAFIVLYKEQRWIGMIRNIG